MADRVWDLSRCWSREQSLAALHRAVLVALPEGSHGTGLTLSTDYGMQITSARYVETLNRLCIIQQRIANNHREGHGYSARLQRSLQEEKVWLNDYQNFEQTISGSVCQMVQYNLNRPHRRFHGESSTKPVPGLPKHLLQARSQLSSSEGGLNIIP